MHNMALIGDAETSASSGGLHLLPLTARDGPTDQSLKAIPHGLLVPLHALLNQISRGGAQRVGDPAAGSR